MRIRLAYPILLCLFLASCATEENNIIDEQDTKLEEVLRSASPDQTLSFFEQPNSTDFVSIPQDPKNPITVEKVKLGKLLYHETGLAIDPKQEISKGNFSCASCHFAGAGFQAGRAQGIGEGGVGFGINGEGREKGSLYPDNMVDVQPIRTPTAMNGAYQINQLWNGQFGATGLNTGTEAMWKEGTPIATNHLGYEGLEIQAIAGLGVHRLGVTPELLDSLGYTELFDRAFPEIHESERYTKEFAGLAIAAYERTILSNQAPFQQWLKGNQNAMTEKEKVGAILFFDEAKCFRCHTGPALNSMEFHGIGLMGLFMCEEDEILMSTPTSSANLGRGGFTGRPEDMYKFKVPQLYNLADSPFYGHGSNFTSIRDIIDYKNKAVPQNPIVMESQLSGFEPLNLSDSEIDAITHFLTHSLRDDNLDRYVPERVLSGNCFPNNDPLSSSQLGCN